MIADQDRSGWFGASDTSMIMGNWGTKTFKKWWMQKMGLDTSYFRSTAMNAGTYYEHAILEYIGADRMDHQILLPEYKLRVNLDGDAPKQIYEVKTHKAENEYKVSKDHWRQVQVQMFAKNVVEGCVPLAQIVSYGLLEEDYKNFFNLVDPKRLKRHHIDYDGGFIAKYLKRLTYLAACLERGAFPHEKPH